MNIYSFFYRVYNQKNRWPGDTYLRTKQIIAEDKEKALGILKIIEDSYDELQIIIE